MGAGWAPAIHGVMVVVELRKRQKVVSGADREHKHGGTEAIHPSILCRNVKPVRSCVANLVECSWELVRFCSAALQLRERVAE